MTQTERDTLIRQLDLVRNAAMEALIDLCEARHPAAIRLEAARDLLTIARDNEIRMAVAGPIPMAAAENTCAPEAIHMPGSTVEPERVVTTRMHYTRLQPAGVHCAGPGCLYCAHAKAGIVD